MTIEHILSINKKSFSGNSLEVRTKKEKIKSQGRRRIKKIVE